MFAFPASSLNTGIVFHVEYLHRQELSALVQGCVHPQGHSSRPRQVSLPAVSLCEDTASSWHSMTGLIMSALQVRLLLQTHRRRDSCHSFKVDRAVATDLTSDDSSTLHPPSEAASRARDPPHPVLALHLVRSTGRCAPQTEPCCSSFPCARNPRLLACPSVPEFGASALPSSLVVINSLMNSASPPVTVTQLSFKGHDQVREALSPMTTDRTATSSSSCQQSRTVSSCAAVSFLCSLCQAL